MLYNLFPSDLPCGEIFRGNIALRKSDKSANCHAATELQGKKTDMRMKPDWLNDNPMVELVTMAEDSYLRHTMTPSPVLRMGMAGTCHGITAISGDKDESRIRQSVVPIVIMCAKRRLPKSKCRNTAMSNGSEYSTRQRSVHSSLSKGKPCTWQRDTVGIFNMTKG